MFAIGFELMVLGRQLSVVPPLTHQQNGHMEKKDRHSLSDHTSQSKVAGLVVGQNGRQDSYQIHILTLAIVGHLCLCLCDIGRRTGSRATCGVEVGGQLITEESVPAVGLYTVDIGTDDQRDEFAHVETGSDRCGCHVVNGDDA